MFVYHPHLHGIVLTQYQYSVDVDTTSKLKSVTQEKDLEELFTTAELAGTEFTAGESGYVLFS